METLQIEQHFTPGGHSHWKGVWGCAAVMTPFSGQLPLPSLPIYRQCAVLVTPVFNFQKIFGFSAMIWPKFQLSRPKFFQIFILKTPIFQEKSAPQTLHFETRVAHIHQKKVECPPGHFTPPLPTGQQSFYSWVIQTKRGK